MEAKDIKNVSDMQRYVEGCLNDLACGDTTVAETMEDMRAYTERVIELVRVIETATEANEPPVDSPLLSVEYLMKLHPSMNIDVARALYKFCKGNGITEKERYGDGLIMLPMLEEAKKKTE